MIRKALDLFCCAGGASYGISKNGFDVTGVDIEVQPHYPFKFIKENVLDLDQSFLKEFEYIWASPPCQGYSTASFHRKKYPMLIDSVRDMLIESGKYYTIENVVGAPLIDPILLCGTMFGLRMYRHRLFESNFNVMQLVHPKHVNKVCKLGRPANTTEFISMCGHFPGVEQARIETGHTWMNQYELAQCIPYKYSEYISKFVPVGV